MNTQLPMPNDLDRCTNEYLFLLMRDDKIDADTFNALCEEAMRRGLVRG
jgi:lipocalin